MNDSERNHNAETPEKPKSREGTLTPFFVRYLEEVTPRTKTGVRAGLVNPDNPA